MLQSFFTVFLFVVCSFCQIPCCLGLLLGRPLTLSVLKNWSWSGLTESSCFMLFVNPFVQSLIIQGYCRAVSTERLGSIIGHLLVQTSYIQKDRLRLLHAFSSNRWWTRWTDGFYRGPRQEKNYLLLAGIEPGSPCCKSDILPLDHGLPSKEPFAFYNQVFELFCTPLPSL